MQINIFEFPFFSFDDMLKRFVGKNFSFIINISFVLYLLGEVWKHYEHMNICLSLVNYALLLTASLLLNMLTW